MIPNEPPARLNYSPEAMSDHTDDNRLAMLGDMGLNTEEWIESDTWYDLRQKV